jgi:amino acid transporter
LNTRSLKFRLVAWYAGWLTLLFIVFGIFVYASLGFYLKRELRAALARRVRQVAVLVQRSPLGPEALGQEIHHTFAPEANNRFTRLTINGTTTYVAGPPSDRSFNPDIVPAAQNVAAGESFDRRLLPDGTALFVVVLSRSVGTNTFVTEEGSAEAPIRTTLHRWLVVLVLGLAVLILGAVSGGFLLAQRALAPVDRIIRSASESVPAI